MPKFKIFEPSGSQNSRRKEYEYTSDIFFPQIDHPVNVKVDKGNKNNVEKQIFDAYREGRPEEIDIKKQIDLSLPSIAELEEIKKEYIDYFNIIINVFINGHPNNDFDTNLNFINSIDNQLKTLFNLLHMAETKEELKNITDELKNVLKPAIESVEILRNDPNTNIPEDPNLL